MAEHPVSWTTALAALALIALPACQAHVEQTPIQYGATPGDDDTTGDDDTGDDDTGDDDTGDDDAGDDDTADEDGDGYSPAAGDCADDNPDIHPDATESCDDTDWDCDSVAAEGCATCQAALASGGGSADGYYDIDPEGLGESHGVYCDMTTDGGGWTLVMRTTDDWSVTQGMTTDHATLYSATFGAPDAEFRLAARLWPHVALAGEHLFIFHPRLEAGGSCDPMFYKGTGGFVTVPEAGPATITEVTASVELISETTFSTTDLGPSRDCVNDFSAVPWFYASCCRACPTFGGNYFDPPSPMVRFLESDADMQGNFLADVCSDSPNVVNHWAAMSSFEVFQR